MAHFGLRQPVVNRKAYPVAEAGLIWYTRRRGLVWPNGRLLVSYHPSPNLLSETTLTKRPPWRPTKLTPAVQEAICTAIRETACSDTAAVTAAGVHPDTLTDWRKRGDEGKQPYADFLRAVEHARAEAERNLAKRMLVLAENQGDWRAYSFLLERRFGELYGRQDKLAVMVSRLSDDELIERARAALDAGAAGTPSGDGSPWLELPSSEPEPEPISE